MTLLAYDPERLASLHVQMRGAVAHHLRVEDPAAFDAVRAVQRAQHSIEQVWMPLVRRLLANDPMGVPGDVLRLEADAGGAAMTMLRVLDGYEPFAAAQVLPMLGLHGDALAEAVDRLVRRWRESIADRVSSVPADQIADLTRPNPTDVLFPLLIADSAAARHYLELAGDHPLTVLEAAGDPELMHQLVLTATSPAVVNAEEAGRLLAPLLREYLAGWRPLDAFGLGDPDWPVFLAEVLAPWTLQLAPLADAWPLTPDERRAVLQMLVDDDRALQRLVSSGDEVRAELAREIGRTGGADQELVASYSGLMAQLLVNRRYSDEAQSQAAWGFLLTIAGTATTFLPGGVPTGLATSAGMAVVDGVLPFDPARAARDEAYAQDYVRTVQAATVADAVYRHWLHDGTIPPTTAPPPLPDPDPDGCRPMIDYRARFTDWLATLPGGEQGALAEHVDRLVSPWVNAYDAGESQGR